jgi:hypothetical protein
MRRAPSLAALVTLVTLTALAAPARRAQADEVASLPESVLTKQASSFDIYSGSHRLGTEKFRVYTIADTVIMTSNVTLDGAAPDSRLPLTINAAFRQRAFDSYPVAFVSETRARRDTSQVDRVICAFRDTVAMVTIERADRGRVEAVGLPPGRLYILEPGVYMQMQVLLADFLARGQEERKQGVLIPSLARVIDVDLKRGPAEVLELRGRRVQTTRADLTDQMTTFHGWLDADGRMWKLTAEGQPLHVERGRDETPKGAPTKGRAPAKHAATKRAATKPAH